MLILEADRISKSYGKVAALTDFSLEISAGETVGLTGLSGSGKSTCARILAGLERPNTGIVRYAGKELTGANPAIQMIFQDPAGSFNPVRTIYQSLSAVLHLQGVPKSQRRDLLSEHFQRVAIVRGMLVHPKVMILDEPTSALDVSVQAQILHLLKDIQKENGMSYVFISHDPSVVEFMADRVISL